MAMRKNNVAHKQAGFTILNMLFAFTVFLLLISFFPIAIKVMKTEIPTIPYSVDLFFEYIQNDIIQAKELTVSGSTLYLSMDNGDTIHYQKYNMNIRRQVNGVGNEILLQNANTIHYEIVSNGVVVSVEVAKQVIKKRLSMAPTIFLVLYFRGG